MRVAVADDDETISAFLRALLEGRGHQVRVFVNGRALITQLQRDTFDLVILDWHMPEADGMAVLDWMRANMGAPPPVIMLTSRADKDDVASALNAGADDYVVKPEAGEVILARVEAVLRRTSPAPAPARYLDVGRYRLDRLANTVFFGGREEQLTAKEFALALLFFQNPNRPLSRAYLLDAVWNSVADLPTRTLDVHVSRIRAKLCLSAEQGYRVHTIFGYGYRLEIAPGGEV